MLIQLSGCLRQQSSGVRINKNIPLEWNGALALAFNPAFPPLPNVRCLATVRVGIVGIEKSLSSDSNKY